MTTVTVTNAKARLTELVNRISRTYESFIITRNGEPQAVLLSYEELEGLLETLEIMTNKRLVRSILRGIKDAERGRVVPFKKIKRS